MRQALVQGYGGAGRLPTGFTRSGGGQGGVSRGTKSDVVSLKAPVGGWNARDPLTEMDPLDAITLDNFIRYSSTGGLSLREGRTTFATGMGAAVESLMAYAPPSGTETLFAATATNIYDCTAEGAASSVVAGLSNGRWQHCMFSTAADNFLVACNGADSVVNYDGTTWTTPTITGVTSSNLINVVNHVARLWFVENNTLDAWYLAASSIAGAATKFPIGPFCNKGGHLVAIASWTRDGGSGMDDFWVAITSKGQAIIYQGSDPASSSTWSKVGTFDVPEPVSRRCFVKIGADLGLITTQGVLPLSDILGLSAAGTAKVAATDKISGAFSAVVMGSADFHGWQLIEYPRRGLLFVNVPVEELGTTHQYVMNTITGSWSRLTGMNGSCWALKDGDLYQGGNNGVVFKYGGLFSDDGIEINATVIWAYNNLGTLSRKMISLIRPVFFGPDGCTPLLGLRADYDDNPITYTGSAFTALGSFWDEAEWDVAEWAVSPIASARWQPIYVEGIAISPALAVALTEDFQINTVDLWVTEGGHL